MRAVHRLTVWLFKPMYSVAELLGLAVIRQAFDMNEWLIAVPLMIGWMVLCTAVASGVRAA